MKKATAAVSVLLMFMTPGNALAEEARRYPTQAVFKEMTSDSSNWKGTIEELDRLADEILSLKGTLNNSDAIYHVFSLMKKYQEKIANVYTYEAILNFMNSSDSLTKQVSAEVKRLDSVYVASAGYVDKEIMQLDYVTRRRIFSEPRFGDFPVYRETFSKESFISWSESELKILNLFQPLNNRFTNIYDILNNVEMDDLPLMLDDSMKNIQFSSVDLSRDKKAVLYSAIMKNYHTLHGTFATILQGKAESFLAEARLYGFNNALSYALFLDSLPSKVYMDMKTISRDSTPLLQRFMKLHGKSLKLTAQYPTDLTFSVFGEGPEYSYDEAVDRVRNALSPLGVDYIKAYNLMVNSSHIDVYPAENKSKGSATITASQEKGQGVPSYIMLNFAGTNQSVITFAHEMGHALHAYFSHKTQPMLLQNAPTVVSEIPSLVNEMLYYMYSIDHAADENEKMYYLEQSMIEFSNIFFNQAMYASFEEKIYQVLENGAFYNGDGLDQLWESAFREYYGDSVELLPNMESYWAGVSHFYEQPFYVYAYAVDACYALQIASEIYSGNDKVIRNYRAFLEKGSSETPEKMLESLGIDIQCGTVLNNALSIFEKWINEYEAAIPDTGVLEPSDEAEAAGSAVTASDPAAVPDAAVADKPL